MQPTSPRVARPRELWKHGLFPAVFYFAWFCTLTWPLISKFSSSFFAGRDDGLQNVWNIWWVNQAVRRPDLYPTIWFTNLLQWPFGTSLVGHTLNPFNGFLAVPLLSFLSLTAAYNTIVVFAFVMGGVTMYWLAYSLTRSYWPSLIAGFLLTFSNYHFAHYSQLQTVSLEWIPLFLLCWYWMLKRPHPLLGIAAALALWLVLLCDDYYFVYCVLAALVIFLWYAISQRSRRFLAKPHLLALLLFGGTVLFLTGPQVGDLLLANHFDPLRGAHDPAKYSADLLALLIPGGFWRFSRWTQGYWTRLPGNITENSVFVALPVFVLIGYLWVRRKYLEPALKQQLYLWSAVLGVFFLLALGPVLHVSGMAVTHGNLMPYTLLGRVLPFLSLSGVPARMIVTVIIASAVLSAFALREILSQRPRGKWIALGLVGILVFEAWPARIVTTTMEVPPYVNVLARLPDDGGVLDLLKTDAGFQLYYQTIHDKPISFGYLARLPTSVYTGDKMLALAYGDMDYAQLWGVYRIRYILTHQDLSPRVGQPYMRLSLLYDGTDARIYQLSCMCELAHSPP